MSAGEFEGVRKQVPKDLVDSVLIPEDRRWQRLPVVDCKGYVTLCGENGERALERLEEVLEIDLADIDLATARLEAAGVEKPFHQSSERVSLLVDRLEHVHLAGGYRSVDSLLEQIEI